MRLAGPPRGVLHAPQGMERVGQRKAAGALHQQPRPSRQPVVAVHDVVVGVAGFHPADDLLGKAADMGRQRQHRGVPAWSGDDVHHAITGNHLNDLTQSGCGGAGEQVHSYPPAHHGASQFVDVDVHATGAAHSRLQQR